MLLTLDYKVNKGAVDSTGFCCSLRLHFYVLGLHLKFIPAVNDFCK